MQGHGKKGKLTMGEQENKERCVWCGRYIDKATDPRRYRHGLVFCCEACDHAHTDREIEEDKARDFGDIFGPYGWADF